MNPFYSHQKFLESTLLSLDYSIKRFCLEFGTGDGSSSIFNKMAKEFNIEIDAYEFDPNWYQAMKAKYELPNYKFHLISYKTIPYDTLLKNKYDLIFLDQMNMESRIEVLEKMRDNSKIFMLHNYDVFNRTVCENVLSIGLGSFFSRFAEWFDMVSYTEVYPPTLLFKRKVSEFPGISNTPGNL